MVKTDEDAFICDMAQTYHIYEWRSYPVKLIATLATGLPQDSRINLKRANAKVDLSTALLAKIVDNTSWLVWAQTEDGQRGLNRPKSVLLSLTEEKKPENTYRTFATTKEFDEWRRGWINGKN